MSAHLHDTDFYAWTRDQAARLRRLADDERIDAALLAEEIEDLGSGDFHAVESYLERIIEHLLKLEFSGLARHDDHWKTEIDTFRIKFEDRVTASMRPKLPTRLDRRYRVARNRARNALEAEVPDIDRRLPKACPYSIEQILGADWFPVADETP